MASATPLPFVLYEDSRCFVLAKPAGMHSVGLPGKDSDNLASRIAKVDPALLVASEKPEDGGLVQRLDQETSGVIMGAKDREAWGLLRDALKEGAIKKSYLIVVEGEFPTEAATETFLGGPNRGGHKVKVYRSKPAAAQRALPAYTKFVRLSYDHARDFSIVRAFAPTARRHQVRAHAAFLKHPLLGDSLYGAKRTWAQEGETTLAPQFLLHAESISFCSPADGQAKSVGAPLPPYFQALSTLPR